ncbi:hypothetical protein [Holdemania sp. 1001302B_160321_E10]|uniref:hypothetical protein n=1 Tax=Holdemania sp. 1001302B_160321_E10 TaxID=2787120 RepID=UPI00189B9E84|nr:hypothetical protein [Holdemania sp. 1001302B_160321_E10]
MKVEGFHFKRGMDNNIVSIVDDTIQIHSYDNIGTGIIRKEKLGFIQNGEIKFILNKKDFNLLRNFNEMDISMNGETISIQSGKVKLKIQNQTEAKEYMPDLSGKEQLNLPVDILIAASDFVGDTDRSKGILVTPNCVTASDGKVLYRFSINTGVDRKISIPTDLLKIINKEVNYSPYLCGNLIVMSCEEEKVYTTLIEGFVDGIERISGGGKGKVHLNKGELIRHLNLASNFGTAIVMDVSNGVLTIDSVQIDSSQSYTGEINVETNIKQFKKGAVIKNLMKIVKLVNDEEINLILGDRTYEIADEDLYSLTLGFTIQGSKEMEI